MRLSSLCDTPSERHLLTEATQAGILSAPLLRRSYLAADHAAGQLLWLPTHSSLGRMRPRAGYVAFMEVSTDGKRPSLRRATAIDPSWLTGQITISTRTFASFVITRRRTGRNRYTGMSRVNPAWCTIICTQNPSIVPNYSEKHDSDFTHWRQHHSARRWTTT